jgi:hypothetical protein
MMRLPYGKQLLIEFVPYVCWSAASARLLMVTAVRRGLTSCCLNRR